MRKSINVVMDEELHQKLKSKCKSEGITITKVISDLVTSYVDGDYSYAPRRLINNNEMTVTDSMSVNLNNKVCEEKSWWKKMFLK